MIFTRLLYDLYIIFTIFSRTLVRSGDCVWSACAKGIWWGPGFIVYAAALI